MKVRLLPPKFSSVLVAALLISASAAPRLHAQEAAGKAAIKKRLPATLDVIQGTAQKVLPLKKAFRLDGVYLPVVRFTTVLGNMDVQLFTNDAPKNAANFLSYVNSGAYNGTFFDRSVKNFVIQGGSYRINSDNSGINQIPQSPAVVNEYKVPNTRGTIAAAKPASRPDGATDSWFFNTIDNTKELGTINTGGFTVFGSIIGNKGFAVMDAIAAVPVPDTGAQSPFTETPLIGHVDGTAPQIDELVKVASIAPIAVLGNVVGQPSLLRIKATSSNPALVTPSIVGNKLNLNFDPTQNGTATIVVRAQGVRGGKVKQKIVVNVAAQD